VLINAPSGYGKSVALDDHLAATAYGLHVGVRNASADEIARLLVPDEPGLASALEAYGQTGNYRSLASWVAAALADRQYGFVAVDDLTDATAEGRRLVYGIADAHKTPTWYLVTRTIADLPLGSWVAQGRATLPVGIETLAATGSEVRELADSLNVRLSPAAAETLAKRMDGWIVGVVFALRFGRSDAMVDRSFNDEWTLISAYIAERVERDLSTDDRAVLQWSPYVSPLTVPVLQRLDVQRSGEILGSLARRGLFVRRLADGVFEVHDILRVRFSEINSTKNSDEVQDNYRRAARAFELCGDVSNALKCYCEARDEQSIARLLLESGFFLLQSGAAGSVWHALRSIAMPAIRKQPHLAVLQAMRLIEKGEPERAEGLLREVSAMTGDPVAMSHLATLLVNQGLQGASDAIEQLADGAKERADVELLGAAMVANAREGQRGRAEVFEMRLREALTREPDPLMKARGLQRLSIARLFLGDLDGALACAQEAVDEAKRHSFPAVEARAWSVCYSVAAQRNDDEEMKRFAELMLGAARRSGEAQVQIAALTALLVFAAESGESDLFATIEQQAAGLGTGFAYRSAFARAYSRSLMAALRGNYQEARGFLQRFIERDRLESCARALAVSLQYLFQAIEKRVTEQVRARLENALKLAMPRDAVMRRNLSYALAVVSIAETLLGRSTEALKHASRAMKFKSGGRDSKLVEVAYDVVTHKDFRQKHADALQHAGLRSYAMFFERLVRLNTISGLELTERERAVIIPYCNGRPARSVAEEAGVSEHTVRVHVRRVSQRAGVHGREALAELLRREQLM
jgi:ATP/maltotriose-dependent transcriptional regulator MalT